MTSFSPPAWRPDQFLRRKPYLEARLRVLRAIRKWFEAEQFDEVDTPALQISPGNEVHLHAFGTRFEDPSTGHEVSYYLHTSPEFAMKKLLVAGMPRIFQVAHVFRNGERSPRHHPEFTMIEWYRAEASLDAIQNDCIGLVRTAISAAGLKIFSANEMICDPHAPWETLGVPDAFMRYANIDLMAALDNISFFKESIQNAGMRVNDDDSWDDLFFRVMGEKIEPFLGKDRPTFLCDYPISMAALARPKADDPRLANRFELYICGYELANAFDELTDAHEQERRFRSDMTIKNELYGVQYPLDEDFLAALHHGLPRSAGIALGFDRLVMLCAGTDNIENVLWMPVAE